MSIEYVQQQLGAAEKIIYTERHHWIFPILEMIRWIVFAALYLAALIILKVVFPGHAWMNWLFLVLLIPAARIIFGFIAWRVNVYVLTNRRVIEASGVVNKTVADSSLEKLTDVVLRQSLFGRMLGYGDIEVLTAAAAAGVNNLQRIRDPLPFKKAMLDAKEELEHELGQSR